jgi:chromosomal replication initiator protein
VGKTHLLYAIANGIRRKNPGANVVYIKGDQFTNELVTAIQTGKNVEFRSKYRDADLFLIDDIQFIEGRNKTMAQFQHTFDSLHNKGKQIVITSDRLPKDIPNLTAALDSRFAMGLMIELTSPDEDTRFEIIKKLAEDNGLVFEEKALRYIAKNFSKNVRELEGAFNKVCAFAEITEQALDLRLAKEVLKCDEVENEITIELIAEVTAQYYDVEIKDIKGTARGQKISTARHMAIYLAREITEKSFVNIADYYILYFTILLSYPPVNDEYIYVNNIII